MAEATTLSLLTWNTSDGTPSDCAPFAWGVEGQRAGIVSVVKSAWPLPDLVCLQEIDAPPEQQVHAWGAAWVHACLLILCCRRTLEGGCMPCGTCSCMMEKRRGACMRAGRAR